MAPRRTRFAEAGAGDARDRDPQAFVAASRPGPQPACRFPAPRRSPRTKAGAGGGSAPPSARSPPASPAAAQRRRTSSLRAALRPALAPPAAPAGLRGAPARPAAAAPAQPLGGGRSRLSPSRRGPARPCRSAAGGSAAGGAWRSRAAGPKWVTMRRQCPRGRGGSGIQGCVGKSVANGR